jgi:superfamily II RNA helicase
MTSYLIQPDLTKPPTDLPANPLPYPLDPFQQHALNAIYQNHHTLICAKTGSGKTAVGEIAIYKALAANKRIFATYPIKSLSNQKFSDLKAQFPDKTVGIMTGDIKFQPDAQILVMTTEILRNLLYKQGTKTASLGLTASLSLDNLGLVIFDECHFINDPDRGKVWEETMILIPPTVQLVLLSATLENPAPFAQWLGTLKKTPVHLIQTQYRVVPLVHIVLDNLNDEPLVTLTPTVEEFQAKTYKLYLDQVKAIQDGHKAFKDKVHNKVVAGEKGAVEGFGVAKQHPRPKTFLHKLNHTLDLLRIRHQLPALVFVFSRKGCETYASRVERDFLTGAESSEVIRTLDHHLHTFESLRTLPQFHQLKALLIKGIAFHHSGLLPMLKEIVEILFVKGLIKVLFATETFAVGLNMPTKTVIFSSLKKFDEKGMRLLRTDEYTQMAGRAGRRGKDTEGLVIYLDDREPVSVNELHQIMKGSCRPVISRMDFGYDFLLKTLNAGNTDWLTLMEQSYWFQQRQQQILLTKRCIGDAATAVSTLQATLTEAQIALCQEKQAQEAAIKAEGGNRYKKLQQEFMKWSATHPISPTILTNYESLLKAKKTLKDELAYEAELRNHSKSLEPTVAFLRAAGYLKESLSPPTALSSADLPPEPGSGGAASAHNQRLCAEDLTLKGVLATEINEGHPILLTELFLSKAAHGLSGAELATILSVFLEDFIKEGGPSLKDLDIPKVLFPVLESINRNANRFGDLEYAKGATKSDDAWNLSIQWTEPVYRWLTEEDIHITTLCETYGTFEGNLVRGFLKLTNLLDEWLSLATFCEHADQLEKIASVKGLLVRGLVLPTSLYLTK